MYPFSSPRDGGSSDVIDGLIPISALHGTGLDNLLHRLEDAVITRTRRKIWKIVVPSHGPELRSVVYSSSLCRYQ